MGKQRRSKRSEQTAAVGQTGDMAINGGQPVTTPKAAKSTLVKEGHDLCKAYAEANEKADDSVRERLVNALKPATKTGIEELVRGAQAYREGLKKADKITPTKAVSISRFIRVLRAALKNHAGTVKLLEENGIYKSLKQLPKSARGRKAAQVDPDKAVAETTKVLASDATVAFRITVAGIQAMKQADPEKARYIVFLGEKLSVALEQGKAEFATMIEGKVIREERKAASVSKAAKAQQALAIAAVAA